MPASSNSLSLGIRRELPSQGISEEIAFVGSPGRRIFSVLNSPLGPSRGGLLICSPLYVEFSKNYRREVVAARALANQGLTVLRFHYRAVGHSDDLENGPTLESLSQDAAEALSHLRERIGSRGVAVLGTRLGALVAAEVARSEQGAPLVFWQPTVRGSAYFRELCRIQLMSDMKSDTEGGSSSKMTERLLAQGGVDILGYTFTKDMYDSIVDRDLATELTGSSGPTLLIQLDTATNTRPEYQSLVRSLRSRDRVVDIQRVQDGETWWFPDPSEGSVDGKPSTLSLIEHTSRWVLEHVG